MRTIFLCTVLLGSVAVAYVAVAASYLDSTVLDTAATEPIRAAKEQQNSDVAEDGTRILFLGDVMLARDVERKIDAYGRAYPFQFVSKLFQQHDLVVANFEASVPVEHKPTADMRYAFSVRDDLLDLLSRAGVTHLSLANNHSYDFGKAGAVHTKERITEHDMDFFGDPYVLGSDTVRYVTVGDERFALIGLDLTVSEYSTRELDAMFDVAREQSEYQFVFVHWGTEYALRHNQEQREWAEWFVNAGADLVVGHHPHVVQDVERIDDVLVFYSLGNFIFDQYFSEDVMRGLVLSVDTGAGNIELTPVTSKETLIAPRFMQADERHIFLESLATRSDQVLQSGIREGLLQL